MPGMMKKLPTPKPKTSKTPKPKFTPPSLAQYKKSAAYKAGDMTYKEYIAVSKNVFKAKNKKK